MHRRIAPIACLLLLLGTPLYAATLSMVAVALNGVPIEPSDVLHVAPNDTVTVELRISGWADDLPDGLRGYDFRLDAATAATSGPYGVMLPSGWTAGLDPQTCSGGEACPAEYPVCGTCNLCAQPGFNPALAAYVKAEKE